MNTLFQNYNLPGVPRSTRFSVPKDMAMVRKAKTWPPLNKTHKFELLGQEQSEKRFFCDS